jgi:protein SCO1
MSSLSSPRYRRLFSIIAVALLALLLGLWVRHNLQPKSVQLTLHTATVFNQPRSISPFQLTDDNGQPFTLENLKGHYSLLFFGFTHCPDLCPTALSMLNQMYKKLASQPSLPLPQIVFISVDPEQDTPAVIKTYLSSFNSAFLGATGSKQQIDQLTQEMSVLYAKVTQAGDATHYTIDHSGTIILVNPKGEFYGVFTLPHDAQQIAADMQSILHTAS